MRLVRFVIPFACVAALPAVAAIAAQGPFDGDWKADTAAARFDPKPDVMLLQGGRYTCRSCAPPYAVPADGAFHPIAGHPYADAVAISITDSRTVVERDRKNGKVTGESASTVSADGATLSVNFTDSSAPNGKVVTGSLTETRVAPAPAGAHPISGSWRPSRVSGVSDDGLRFTIRTEGDAFHFSTPTGQRIDGRIGGPYVPVVGDIGGTMTRYERIDARTLRETDMRRGKVVSVATITASPDGRTLTNVSHDLLHGTTNTLKAVRQ